MTMKIPYWLEISEPELFPDTSCALDEPDGLLALGGDLSLKRLTCAYQKGIFPWYSDGQPIMWWSPNPRSILSPENIHISRSMRKTLRQTWFDVTFDHDFSGVIKNCATVRSEGTWITNEMQLAYIEMHKAGFAHSVEIWVKNELVGGLYGIALGKIFFGESMFSKMNDVSKIALVKLSQKLDNDGFKIIDCQVQSQHLSSLGAELVTRTKFNNLLQLNCQTSTSSNWQKND
ncbi:Leucyl/phenylalanyl-tRNA--protein transferase [hydrothermal vent metagenome]|uniref:Leucyl/phenylalanyl-tRNA--protein transferase n=1 Tax=hydrothermal vent metagenome TaxID=652676 RepID=A0A3B0ZQM6_9ZZZZ